MENENTLNSAPWWFWLIAILALLWFLMDLSAFAMRVFMLEDMISGMPEDQQSLYRSMPMWVNIVFAAEVFGGLLGALALLLKKQWAQHLFAISLVGTFAQTAYLYFLSNTISVMGTPAILMPLVAIVICAGLLYFTKVARNKLFIR